VSERTLKQLVGALAVVVGLWVVSLLVGGGSGSIAATGEIGGFFDGVGASSVDMVQIAGPAESVRLDRTSDGWTANGHPGDQAAISRFLGILDEVQIGEMIANNPANHDRMGVSADSAIRVTFEVDGGERTLLLGNSGRRFGTAYVRLPDADDVYLLEGDLRSQATRRVDNWRNRAMVAVDSAEVARIEVDRDGSGYALVRGDSAWTVEGGGEATGSAVNGILAELSSLIATGFLEEGDSIAALDQETTTRAYSDSGDMLAEIRIGAGQADRWARTVTDEYIYRVSSFRAGRVAPARETVLPEGS
jgi:hypothetical protein